VAETKPIANKKPSKAVAKKAKPALQKTTHKLATPKTPVQKKPAFKRKAETKKP
jgi:hypothetical protein